MEIFQEQNKNSQGSGGVLIRKHTGTGGAEPDRNTKHWTGERKVT